MHVGPAFRDSLVVYNHWTPGYLFRSVAMDAPDQTDGHARKNMLAEAGCSDTQIRALRMTLARSRESAIETGTRAVALKWTNLPGAQHVKN